MSVDLPWDAEDGDDRSPAVRKLLAEACRALEFDRAHLLLVGDRKTTRELPRLLAAELAGEIETVVVHLTGREESVADRVAEAIRDARRSPGPANGSAPRAPGQERLALVLPDALAIPAASLRTLNEMTARSGMAQRLVLLVDRDATPVADPARELVGRLGAGMSKVELESGGLPHAGPRMAGSDESTTDSQIALGPPVVSDTRARRVRPVRVRARRRPGQPRPLRWIASTGVLGAAILLLTAPGIVRRVVTPAARAGLEMLHTPEPAQDSHATRQPEPKATQRPEPNAKPPDAAAPTPSDAAEVEPADAAEVEPADAAEVEPADAAEADVAEGPELPPVGIPRLPLTSASQASTPPTEEPLRAAAPQPQPVDAAVPPTPSGVERRAEGVSAPPPVIVSFNAAPWANLEIDGRDVGATPIGDLALAPGRHELRATFPDGRVVERSLHVDSLQNRFRIE